MMKKLLLVLVLVSATVANAAEDNRKKKRFGIHLGFLGDPFPTLVGGNLNFNLTSFARLTAGYGSISATTTDLTTGTTIENKVTTYGGGLRLLVPGWNFSPVAGVSWAKIDYTGSSSVGGFTSDGSHVYLGGGLDWQAANGFNFGAGYNFSLATNPDGTSVGGLPYLNLGWYF